MTRFRRAATVVAFAAFLLTAVACVAAARGTAASAASTQKLVYFNLGSPDVKPKTIFTAFNSSPTIEKITWSGWGTATATGKGIYVSTCASCAPPKHRTAVITLSGRVSCPNGSRYRTYRKATVKVGAPDVGSKKTTYKLASGCDLEHKG